MATCPENSFKTNHLDLGDFGSNFLFGGLRRAYFFGIVQVVTALTGLERCDSNERDLGGILRFQGVPVRDMRR